MTIVSTFTHPHVVTRDALFFFLTITLKNKICHLAENPPQKAWVITFGQLQGVMFSDDSIKLKQSVFRNEPALDISVKHILHFATLAMLKCIQTADMLTLLYLIHSRCTK